MQITLAIENGISTVESIDSSALQLGTGRIKDLKFADSYTLLVLWESNGKQFLTVSATRHVYLMIIRVSKPLVRSI
jgi:hypothetical protein